MQGLGYEYLKTHCTSRAPPLGPFHSPLWFAVASGLPDIACTIFVVAKGELRRTLGGAGEDRRHAHQEGRVQRTGQTSFVVVSGLLDVVDP